MKILEILYTLRYHRRIIADLEAELEKPFEIRMTEFRANMGAVNVTLESPAILIFTEAMIGLYRSFDGAKNYMAFSVVDPKTNEVFEITIQRKDGKTAADIVGEMREKMILFDIMVATLNDIADNKGKFNEGLEEFLTHNNLRK